MKEGLVLEVHKSYVIVLTDKGEFLKLQKIKNPILGEVYSAREYKPFMSIKPSMFYSAAAVVIFIITSFAGYTAYANQIVGVIDITGDKTVKLFINREGTVKKVEGIDNTDSLKNLNVNDAVDKITQDENLPIKFTDPSNINATAKQIKNSNIDFNEINNKLQKTLEEKKNKVKEDKDKKDNNKGNSQKNDKKPKDNLDSNDSNPKSPGNSGEKKMDKANKNGSKKNKHFTGNVIHNESYDSERLGYSSNSPSKSNINNPRPEQHNNEKKDKKEKPGKSKSKNKSKNKSK